MGHIILREYMIAGKPHQQVTEYHDSELRIAFTEDQRARLRSRTFPGIAAAMAAQWGRITETKGAAID